MSTLLPSRRHGRGVCSGPFPGWPPAFSSPCSLLQSRQGTPCTAAPLAHSPQPRGLHVLLSWGAGPRLAGRPDCGTGAPLGFPGWWLPVRLGVMGPRGVAVPLAASAPGPRCPAQGLRGLYTRLAADVVTALWTVPGCFPVGAALLLQEGNAATFQVPLKQGLALCFGAKGPRCLNVSASHRRVFWL